MREELPAGLRRTLDRIRAAGENVPVEEVARALFASSQPLSPRLARRLVATVLDRPLPSLPERLDARELRPGVEREVSETPLSEAGFAVVDLETTGLSADRDSIIEIGAVRVSRLECAGEFTSLVRLPRGLRLSRGIADLTGIDDGMLREAPPVRRALGDFRRWLREAGEPPFVAHNASFDSRFTWAALERHRLPQPRSVVLCTKKLSRRLLPQLGRYNLDYVCAHLGITNPARHRALGDAKATARALVELLGIALEAGAARTLGELIDLERQPPTPRRRRKRSRAPSDRLRENTDGAPPIPRR